jgi:hypothetical protein
MPPARLFVNFGAIMDELLWFKQETATMSICADKKG